MHETLLGSKSLNYRIFHITGTLPWSPRKTQESVRIENGTEMEAKRNHTSRRNECQGVVEARLVIRGRKIQTTSSYLMLTFLRRVVDHYDVYTFVARPNRVPLSPALQSVTSHLYSTLST